MIEPYYQTELGKLYCGDCSEVLKGIPENSMESLITDPPFGIGFKYTKPELNTNPDEYWNWLKPIMEQMEQKIKMGGFMAVWQTQLYFPYFWNWFGKDIHIYASCKNFVQLRKTSINYAYDPIIMKYKNGERLLPSKPKRNVDFFVCNTAKYVSNTKAIERKHPCPRPIDQVKAIIENFSTGTVLDCFFGAGTVGVACEQLGRKWVGIEIEKKYCDLAILRIEEAKQQVRLDTEQSNDEKSPDPAPRGR